MRKIALALLLLVPFSFAAWSTYAIGAMMIATALLGVLYAVGTGFDLREMQILAKDELYQLIVLALLILLLFGTDNLLNSISQNSAFTLGQPTLQDAAVASLNETIQSLSVFLAEDIASADKNIMYESSKISSCYIVGGGYSVTSCGGFSMLSTPLSMAGSLIGYAIAEAAAVKKLILVSQQISFVLILPLGIILRAFRFTRGAGGFLMAFAICLYLLVPAGIVFVELLEEEFEYQLTAPDAAPHMAESAIYLEGAGGISISGCNAGNPWGDVGGDAVDTYGNMRGELKKYLYVMLIKATLGPVLAIMLFIGGLRALTGLFGAPIDVSALGRFF